MKSESRPKLASSSRLDQAVEHVGDRWFPPNPVLLDKLRESVKGELSTADMSLLISELKGDFALFTQCVRQLARMVSEESDDSMPLDPLAALEQLDVAHFKQLIEGLVELASPHSLSASTPLQTSRLGEAMVSAATAEVLGEHEGLASGLCYSAALLRQLGYTLIAWNYPKIYQRAVSSLATGANLDIQLTRTLGFSPSVLALTILRRWGVAPELCAAVSLDQNEDYTPEIRAIGATLAKVCKVGETLARANNPDIYPDAQDEWQVACQEIESRLGPTGMSLINERVIECCEAYSLMVPHLFRGGQILAPQMLPAHAQEPVPERRNRFLSRCHPLVKDELQDFYRALAPFTAPAQEPLRQLVQRVIPSAGFTAGAVYTIEPSSGMLIPQLHVGSLAPQPVPLSYGADMLDDELIVRVFQEFETQTERHLAPNGLHLVRMAGVVGYSQRMGVLALEMLESRFDQKPEDARLHFDAIIQALNDALFLR